MTGSLARHALLIGVTASLIGCAAPSDAMPPAVDSGLQAGLEQEPPTPSTPPIGDAAPAFSYEGELTQGGWIRGKLPRGTWTVQLGSTNGSQAVQVEEDGSFFAGIDRDAPDSLVLKAAGGGDIYVKEQLTIAPRAWNIEHVNVAKGTGRSSEEWWKKREPEWLAIKAAREKESGAKGWQQAFIWPVEGRISGRFGSQRIYRGEPGSYHSGLDIAPGAGTPFVAPADGVVVLAAQGFSLEGNLLIIDHGMGLNSAFLHAQSLSVEEGDVVTQGQMIGRVGSSGRATGPHLHWGIKWRDARLDPLLFLPSAE